MDKFLLFALVGLGSGAVYAALGLGLVVTYKGTGIINFATGAMGMWSAYVFDELRKTGNLVFPIVLLPHKIDLGGRAPFTVALVLAVLSGTLIGVLAHFLVFRPLRRAPVLAKVVASVGLMITLEALVVIHFKSTARRVDPILPDSSAFKLGRQGVPQDRLWLTLIVVLVGVALWAYFRYTKLGLATRAAAENERAASLAGYSPQLLAGTTWMISSTVVSLIAILASPFLGLTTVGILLLVVPALACALVGRLSSIGIVVAAGLGLGILQSEITYLGTKRWWPDWARTGFTDAVPFLVVIAALFLVGRSLPSRGAVESDPLPEVVIPRNNPKVVIPVVAAGVAALLLTGGTYRFGVITSMIVAIIALSLVVLTGLVGQISLAQAAFAGSAGFALSRLADDAGIPFPFSTIIATLLALVLGLIVGLPALRIRGAQLAVVTLAMAVALERFLFRNPSFTKLSGNKIPDPSVFGFDLSVRSSTDIARIPFGLLVLGILVLVALAVGNLARSATGRRFLAVRSNERAGAAVGINVAASKLTAFAIASFLAGLGGALIGYSRGQLSADSFTVLVGVSFLAFAYLGGITSISGALVAGTFAPLGIGFVIFQYYFHDLTDGYLLISGVTLISTAIFNPIGIAGAFRQNVATLRRRRRTGAVDVEASVDDDVADAAARVEAGPRPERSIGHVLLETDALSVSYGGLRAVDAVTISVRAGQIVGLIGPNGAGKTTFIDALTGFVPYVGTIRFDGTDLDGFGPHRRARRGLARTWQSMELFGDLTARDNLRVASESASLQSVLADIVHPQRETDQSSVDEVLRAVDLSAVADEKPASLPLGQQKLLGLARALATRPRLVLLDEPAAGLDTGESRRLGIRLAGIAASGIAVFLVDHDMGLVLDVCDYVYVLEFGQLIAQGTPAEIRNDDRVIEAYLGQAGRAAKAATTSAAHTEVVP
jgi:ABC-type branched-subunit amino acid transport system ATPase component/branched-subunit amino acid ABC-type transport system permease component